MDHVVFTAGEGQGNAVVVVCASWLDMGVGLVDSQSADAFVDGFFVPSRVSVAVPELGSERVERNAVEGDTKILVSEGGCGLVFFWFGGDSESVSLG